jgi:hypothetical protein
MKLLMLLLLSSCATQPMTEDERMALEYKHEQTFEAWNLCRDVYKQNGTTWYSEWHMTSHHLKGKVRPRIWDMRSDLGINNCHYIFRRIGAEFDI